MEIDPDFFTKDTSRKLRAIDFFRKGAFSIAFLVFNKNKKHKKMKLLDDLNHTWQEHYPDVDSMEKVIEKIKGLGL